TGRFSFVSVARYTVPIPPSPSGASTRYAPMSVPAGRESFGPSPMVHFAGMVPHIIASPHSTCFRWASARISSRRVDHAWMTAYSEVYLTEGRLPLAHEGDPFALGFPRFL